MTQNSSGFDAHGLPPGTRLRADEVAPRTFATRMKDEPGKHLLIDVRTRTEWETSRVEPAVHVPMEEIEYRAEDLDLDQYETVGILCHHGVRSLKVALALREMGHKNAFSIAGGIELWSKAVDAGVPRYERDRMTGRCVRV